MDTLDTDVILETRLVFFSKSQHLESCDYTESYRN